MPSSRLEAVALSLRELVLSGAIAPGAKITEVGIAKQLGVSRTPVRLALQTLESEGLVIGEPNRGFTVRKITVHDVLSGFDVRGTLEGLACRLVAEAGMRRSVESALGRCVEEGDNICKMDVLNERTVRHWAEINREFHRLILEATENSVLVATHELACRNPLVGPASLAFSASRLKEDTALIAASQRQHRVIWNALRDGQGARAEYLAREHIQGAKENTAKHLRAHADTEEESQMLVTLHA